MDGQGNVRICPWFTDSGIIGNVVENSLYEVWNSETALKRRRMLAQGDYSMCNPDECPYMANGNIEEYMVELEEFPKWPERLAIAFEHNCNYKCTCCTIPSEHANTINHDKIEEEIRKAMPHATTLDINGLGEFFCSTRALKLLKEWEPEAPEEECTVYIETNGSLFDEEHWEQIKNIERFNVKVSLTVMSFDEKIYQELSGTKLPISVIEHNLEFLRKLRQEGKINYLQLNTVYQERNFRTMPDLVKRFLEYGADYIRLRPYVPIGEESLEAMWFKDVRNAFHPYHKEFLEVWKDPIFKHPKVYDWGGGKASLSGKYPNEKDHKKVCMVNDLMTNRRIIDCVRSTLAKQKDANGVVIYGAGAIGKILCDKLMENGITVLYFIDKHTAEPSYRRIPILRIEQVADKEKAPVLFSIVENREQYFDALRNELLSIGYSEAISLGALFLE